MEELNREQKQYIKMISTPIPKLVTTLAIPTIISMLVTSVYNTADTYFVSQLGTSAAGAVGIVFSLMAVIQAFGFAIGMGSGSIVSRLLGQQKYDEANTISSSGFFMALVFGLILTVLGILFIDSLMILLGSTKTILPYARDYARYILFGAPIMCASFVLNNILRAEGKAFLSMIGIAFGGILNIILDPIFIFSLGLGTSGAAIATLISQCVSFSILLSCFITRKSTTNINIKNISLNILTYFNIFKTGFPSLCRQGLASIATVALNVNAAVYDDAAVAAMSIVNRIFMLINSIMLGFGQGFQPVLGYNYGAEKYVRVKKAIYFSLSVGFILMFVLSLAGFIFAPGIISLFRKNDLDVIAIGSYAFRAQCLILPLLPMSIICNMTFQVLGKSLQATILSISRQGIYFFPLIMVLPNIIGIYGVEFVQPIADLLTFLTCFPFIIPFMKELNFKIKETQSKEAM